MVDLNDMTTVFLYSCLHGLMVEDGAFSHKIDSVTIFLKILNLEGHPNCITGSGVTAILLKGWILSIGGASASTETLHLHTVREEFAFHNMTHCITTNLLVH